MSVLSRTSSVFGHLWLFFSCCVCFWLFSVSFFILYQVLVVLCLFLSFSSVFCCFVSVFGCFVTPLVVLGPCFESFYGSYEYPF